MDGFSYLTVVDTASGLYKEKGSKFLSFVFSIQSDLEAKSCLDSLRKEYYDARHHCFAWVIGTDKSRFRVSDDGEPSHSAGDPIMGQIRSRNLTNVLVVVVRYFGGIKLGVGGLIIAYRTAANDALDKARIVEKEITESLTIRYDYSYTPEVMRLVKNFELPVLSQDFQIDAVMHTSIKRRLKQQFVEKTDLLVATGTQIELQWPKSPNS